jgi:cell division protein FtsL
MSHTIRKKIKKQNGITFGMVSVIFMAISIVLILTMIKIYYSNQIYHESKKVNSIKREVSILKSEKTMIEQNIEALKFKKNITDAIFDMEE